MSKTTKRIAKGLVLLAPILYLLPKFTIFYLLCGLYDVSRNSEITPQTVSQYFFGNGIFTWILSPINVLLDIGTLPFRNKGVYRLADLPPAYQDEIRRLIDAVHRQNLVEKLDAVAGQQKRSMFFFKWYGNDVKTVVDIPAFHESYSYIKTIGVSVFNRKQSTSAHFGPLRATLRVLYNINDMKDRSAYIKVGQVENYWNQNKLFIFDDTLLHQSFNNSDQARYCMFIDIMRPSVIPAVMNVVVSVISRLMSAGSNAVFYNNWKVFKN